MNKLGCVEKTVLAQRLLAEGGFVQKQKIGRSNFYINVALNAILMGNAGHTA